MFLAWLALGFGSSVGDRLNGTGESWVLATLGMLLIVCGLAFFVLAARRMSQRDSDSAPLYYFLAANFVAAVVVLLTVFNPLVYG